MLIVDAQCHVWGANTPDRPWPVPPKGFAAVKPHKDFPVSAEYLLREMDAVGVHRAVLVPPSWEGDRNDLALEAANRYPDRFAVMGRLNVDAPDAREQVRNWRKQSGMLGLRFTFQTPLLVQPLLDGRVDWVWGEAERAQVPVKIMAPQRLAPTIGHIAERHPDLRIVMDHLSLLITERDEKAFSD